MFPLVALSKRVSFLGVSRSNATAARPGRYRREQESMDKYRTGECEVWVALVGLQIRIVCLLETVVLCKVETFVFKLLRSGTEAIFKLGSVFRRLLAKSYASILQQERLLCMRASGRASLSLGRCRTS